VQQGRVYLAPSLPFGWFDRPPSVNRLIGARWLVHVLHPGRADGTLEDEVRRFYELFYHHTLTPPQLEAVLSGARGLGR
jgi:iron complex transport system substrate-binding protein